MNNWTGSGFLSRNPDIKEIQTKNGENMKMARFTVACQRKGKNAGADFVGIVAYGKNAEVMEKWFKKGSGIELRGHIQTGSYEKNGQKIYTTDIIADEIEFAKARKDDQTQETEPQPQNTQTPPPAPDNAYMDIDDSELDSLPFR